MTIEKYQELIDEIGKQVRIKNPQARYDLADMEVEGTRFSLCRAGDTAPGMFMIYTDFGPLPKQGRKAVLMRLLESNLGMSGAGNVPIFSVNADTDHVLLLAAASFEDTNAERVLAAMNSFAEMAAEWRKSYFLLDNEKGASSIASRGAAAPLAVSRSHANTASAPNGQSVRR